MQVFDHPELYPKLTGAKRSFGGYPYWVKNQLVVDDVLKRLNIPDEADFNEETLKELVAKISDSRHGKMGQVLWDLHVSSTPLVTSNNVSKTFPLKVSFARTKHLTVKIITVCYKNNIPK